MAPLAVVPDAPKELKPHKRPRLGPRTKFILFSLIISLGVVLVALGVGVKVIFMETVITTLSRARYMDNTKQVSSPLVSSVVHNLFHSFRV